MTHEFERKTFTTSRLAEFSSKEELVRQTGHPIEDWPVVSLKELGDNSIDACESAGIPPVVLIDVDDDGITVTDNGPGISPETVKAIVDYSTKTSSNEGYVSPTRGAQGNALQTILAMGYALTQERGQTIIESKNHHHQIVFSVDPLRQTPTVNHIDIPLPIHARGRRGCRNRAPYEGHRDQSHVAGVRVRFAGQRHRRPHGGRLRL